jgi:hypothetical protein
VIGLHVICQRLIWDKSTSDSKFRYTPFLLEARSKSRKNWFLIAVVFTGWVSLPDVTTCFLLAPITPSPAHHARRTGQRLRWLPETSLRWMHGNVVVKCVQDDFPSLGTSYQDTSSLEENTVRFLQFSFTSHFQLSFQ